MGVSGKQVYIRFAIWRAEPYKWSAGDRGRDLTFNMEGFHVTHIFSFQNSLFLLPSPWNGAK